MSIRISFIIFFFTLLGCKTKKEVDLHYLKWLPKNEQQLVVNDYSSLFSKSQKDSLAKKLIDYELISTNQIVVVTVDSITPYGNIQTYASDLGNYWGVGQKNIDNGLVIVLCPPERKIGISTGYGTEKILTDSICKLVIDSTMIPYFKNSNYYQGINVGLDSLIKKWNLPFE